MQLSEEFYEGFTGEMVLGFHLEKWLEFLKEWEKGESDRLQN